MCLTCADGVVFLVGGRDGEGKAVDKGASCGHWSLVVRSLSDMSSSSYPSVLKGYAYSVEENGQAIWRQFPLEQKVSHAACNTQVGEVAI